MSSSSPTLKEIVETLLYVSVDDVYNLIRQNDGLSHLNEKNTKINYDQVFLLNADRRSIVYFELIRIGPLPAESYRIEVEKTGDNKVLVRKQMDRANPGLLIPLDFAKKVTVGVDNVTLASGQTVSEVIQDTARNYGFLSCPKEIDYNGKGLLLSGIVKKESENDRYLLYYVYKSLKGKGKNPEVYFALVDKDMNIVYFDNGAPEHNNEWKVPLMPGWQRGFTNEISDRNIPISDIEDAELSKQVIGFFIEQNLTGPEITSKQSNVEPGLFLPVLRSLYNSYAETKVIVRLYEDREGFLSPREDMGYKNKRNEFNRLSTELLRLAQRWYLTKARIKKGQSTAWALEEFIDEQAIKKVVGGYDSSGEKVLGTNQDRLRENL